MEKSTLRKIAECSSFVYTFLMLYPLLEWDFLLNLSSAKFKN